MANRYTVSTFYRLRGSMFDYVLRIDPSGVDRRPALTPRCEAPITPATRRHFAAIPPPVVA